MKKQFKGLWICGIASLLILGLIFTIFYNIDRSVMEEHMHNTSYRKFTTI